MHNTKPDICSREKNRAILMMTRFLFVGDSWAQKAYTEANYQSPVSESDVRLASFWPWCYQSCFAPGSGNLSLLDRVLSMEVDSSLPILWIYTEPGRDYGRLSGQPQFGWMQEEGIFEIRKKLDLLILRTIREKLANPIALIGGLSDVNQSAAESLGFQVLCASWQNWIAQRVQSKHFRFGWGASDIGWRANHDGVIPSKTATFAWDEQIKEWCSWEDAGYFSHEHPTPRANQEFAQDLQSSVERWLDGQKNNSVFMTAAETMKHRLGKSLCLAKWKQVSLHLTTGLNNSCYHPPLHKISAEDIVKNPGALHNTQHKKQQRVMMLRGERPAECQYCWNMEDLGQLSDRHYRSGEPWAAIDFGSIAKSTGEEDDVVPSYVEVNFNSACNLQCSYCSPQFSSSWMDEVQRHGAYPTRVPHNDPQHFLGDRRPIPAREHNPYLAAFWAWWPTLYPQLKHFRMTGGEPLMDRNTYKVFDYVLALPKPDLHLNVTSNFSVEPKLFDQYLNYVRRLCGTNIEHFMQYVSLDSGNPSQAQYIRHGLQFRRLWDYVHRYLEEIPYRNSLTFIITMNNLTVMGLQQQLEWILELRKMYSTTYQRVWFDTPVLRQPVWQSLQILPPAYADMMERVADWMELQLITVDNPNHGFKDFEVQRLRRDIAWMRNGHAQDWFQARADFYRFFSEHDRRRGTDFLATFPEMRQWWQECQGHAQRS